MTSRSKPTVRRTKIVATIGPASESPETLGEMIEAGMDVARLGLAHGTMEDHRLRLKRIRDAADRAGRWVGILADLPGPKVRTRPFPDEHGVFLEEDTSVVIEPGEGPSNHDLIHVDHPEVLHGAQVGHKVVLGDGAIVLTVDEVAGERLVAVVERGGRLQGRPGVLFPSTRLGLSSPTPHDLELLHGCIEADVDIVAVSFVRSAADVRAVREAAGSRPPMIVAKIETREAIDHLDEIIAEADGVMVARGDLGTRLPLEDVPHLQKDIVRRCVAYGRPAITATQMLESMINAPSPTRAEVTDIANAVFDGSSALMLSGETAIGHDPVNTVRTMARVAERAEREFDYFAWGSQLGRQQTAAIHGASTRARITAALSAAAWRASTDTEATAIIACTEGGGTPRAISRFRPTATVIGATPNERTARQLTSAWGVIPMLIGRYETIDDIVWFSVQAAVQQKLVKRGDLVVVLVGDPQDPDPITDVLRLVRVR